MIDSASLMLGKLTRSGDVAGNTESLRICQKQCNGNTRGRIAGWVKGGGPACAIPFDIDSENVVIERWLSNQIASGCEVLNHVGMIRKVVSCAPISQACLGQRVAVPVAVATCVKKKKAILSSAAFLMAMASETNVQVGTNGVVVRAFAAEFIGVCDAAGNPLFYADDIQAQRTNQGDRIPWLGI